MREALSQTEIGKLFPSEKPLPPDGVFELGLVLGGTVSAGAYTAGVLDFLIEALDTWTAARDRGDPDAPAHSVKLAGIAGTSGGGINGAIALRAFPYAFPPVRQATPARESALNPLYDTWVNRIGIGDFLETDDLDRGLYSLLNSDKLTKIAKKALGYVGAVRNPRPWVANPFRLFTMVTNLRGIPYRIAFRGETGLAHDLVEHADFVRFALTGIGAPTGQALRPDEFGLDHTTGDNWATLADAALATSAFPIALEARPLRRPMDHLRYRVVAVPGDGGAAPEVRPIVPTWSALARDGVLPAEYAFFCVDGGATNNEPIDVMRTFLAGMTARNPRDGAAAKRATILIDPFADPETLDPFSNPDTLDDRSVPLINIGHRRRLPPGEAGADNPVPLVGALIDSWTYNARFKPVDLALAQHPDVYSRFLVAPTGPAADPAKPGTMANGAAALASGGLFGFLGFFDPAYVRYDFLLGRRNCQRFLERYLIVPADNPIIRNVWTGHQRELYRVEGEPDPYYPVIPLMGACRDTERLDSWPKGKFEASSIEAAVRRRVERLLAAAADPAVPKSPLVHLIVAAYLALGKTYAEDKLTEFAIQKISAALRKSHLV